VSPKKKQDKKISKEFRSKALVCRFKNGRFVFCGEPKTPELVKLIRRVFGKRIKTDRGAADIILFLMAFLIVLSFHIFVQAWAKF
jgi:hypothetical protein